jgi:hypothetical protein
MIFTFCGLSIENNWTQGLLTEFQEITKISANLVSDTNTSIHFGETE